MTARMSPAESGLRHSGRSTAAGERSHRPAPVSARARERRSAALALLLLVPAPSIGTALAMSVDATQGTWVGQGVYAFSKLWIAVLPVAWLVWVDRHPLSWSPPRRGGLGVGIGLGVALSLGIWAAYASIGPSLINAAQVQARAMRVGIGEPSTFILFAGYLILVNSLIEEYVWRWFVFRKCEAVLPHGRGGAAVLLSALLFTVHHVIALRAQFDWFPTILASMGVFAAGVVWSWCYSRYQSVWPGYLSHAIVDLALLWIGWLLIFVV